MSTREIAVRLAQALRRRVDVARHRLGLRPVQPGRKKHGPPAGRFFFDAAELPALLELLRTRLPEQAAHLIARAETIGRHRFDLLGYEGLDFGMEIDWALDPVHQIRAPRRPWPSIPYLDFSVAGDHKVSWELNRHQHLVTLAKAFLLSGNRRFLDEVQTQWHAWQVRNPYPLGINWASSLEVAFRALSWLWVRALLAASLPEKFRRDLDDALALHGRYISRYLSTYFAPNTHLLGEGVALFFLGTLCPQFARAARWQERGWKIVLQEAQRQVFADGMHFEQSTYYHVYALDFFLHARILAANNGVAIPAELDATIERMAEALRVQSQAGAPPRFGDDDGGRLFDPQRNRVEHLLDPLATVAILYERGDFKAAAGALREETVWLLGAQSAARFDALGANACPPTSGRLADSGIYSLVAPAPLLRQVLIDAGPHGYGAGGHGHADALSLQWIARGRHWLTDPGAFCYSLEGGRDRFRGTAAHNTLMVDGQDQALPGGPFAWCTRPETVVERWLVSPRFDLFTGSHNGYTTLPDAVTHRRWVVSWKDGPVLVRDLAIGNTEHDLMLTWRLGPEFRRVQEAAALLSFSAGAQQEPLTFCWSAAPGWSCTEEEDEWSPAYGCKTATRTVRYRARVPLPTEFAVMLSHETGEAALARLPSAAGEPSAYEYSHSGGSMIILFHDGPGGWQWRDWSGDACFVAFGTQGEEPFLTATEVSRLAFRGHSLLDAAVPLEFWELRGGGAIEAALSAHNAPSRGES